MLFYSFYSVLSKKIEGFLCDLHRFYVYFNFSSLDQTQNNILTKDMVELQTEKNVKSKRKEMILVYI